MKYIDYKLSDKNIAFYIGAILLLCSHLIHFTQGNADLVTFFKVLFILGYSFFNLSEFLNKGNIHIATLIMRTSIITMVAVSIYYDSYHKG